MSMKIFQINKFLLSGTIKLLISICDIINSFKIFSISVFVFNVCSEFLNESIDNEIKSDFLMNLNMKLFRLLLQK